MTQQIAQTIKGPIEYRLLGQGPVVMVMNGGHCSRDTRLSHDELANAGFSVLTPSRPGYDSTPANAGHSAQAAADAMAVLLETLNIAEVVVIGISAGGPTALAFAQQYPMQTRGLILEAAKTTPWAAEVRRVATRMFGRTERLTWGALKLGLRLMPETISKTMLREFTTLEVAEVWRRMSPSDRQFLHAMLMSMQSGQGFVNDLTHHLDRLTGITAPTLVIYSPYDNSVPPINAQRVRTELPQSRELQVSADSHLLWIGSTAQQVWEERLAFLQSL